MEEVSLNETETRYYGDLFLCCDVEKTGKIPMLKATELFRSANISNDVISEITSLAGIPATALHISRAQFYGCLKLIAAHQACIPLREELLSTDTVQLALPRFSWKESCGDETILDEGLPANGSSNSRRNSLNTNQLSAATPVNAQSEVERNEAVTCLEVNSAQHLKVIASESCEKVVRRKSGSPEAWSTNSDSPTPTNSVAERPWAKENLWQGLLGDEHRQLLGTEEESSDRHSSDEDYNEQEVNVLDLAAVYQITKEQREYYVKQFMSVQHDPQGLLSGLVARVFFEKSRIPIEELRHIWQLCDVTRDGALSLSEFIAAMHLVVLRRNNIPLPATLPACLHPNVLQVTIESQQPAEADLLHLHDDDEEENTDNTVIGGTFNKSVNNVTTACGTPPSGVVVATVSPSAVEGNHSPKTKAVVAKNQLQKDVRLWNKDMPSTQWTKFSESPTSNVSSPGPKPVNFDMQRTAQAVVSDPQILHPVPLRVTPVANTLNNITTATTEVSEQEVTVVEQRDKSPKQYGNVIMSASLTSVGTNMNISNRDSVQSSDLRAIQRPQAKKLPPPKNAGALPPPPQREPSLNSNTSIALDSCESLIVTANNNNNNNVTKQKDVPPLPPPRPSHRHGRSSSLDLNKFKINSSGFQHADIMTQTSFDLQICAGFADFTQFPKHTTLATKTSQNKVQSEEAEQEMHSLNDPPVSLPALPPSRLVLQTNQRVSAFEVYRKPNSAQSPTSALAHSKTPTQIASGSAVDVFEKRVNSINESLRHVSFKDQSTTDVLRYLRDQNNLLMRLCSDLSDELQTVLLQKEELRMKLENLNVNEKSDNTQVVLRTGSSISAPVSANITGGSNNSSVTNTTTSFL